MRVMRLIMLHTKEEPPAGPLALLRPLAPLAPTRRRRLTATVDNPAAVVVTKDAPIITIAKNIPKIETQLRRTSQRKLTHQLRACVLLDDRLLNEGPLFAFKSEFQQILLASVKGPRLLQLPPVETRRWRWR